LEAKTSINSINLSGSRNELKNWINSDISNFKQIKFLEKGISTESEIISVTFESNGRFIEID
jgi:hypothetical protein